MDIKKTSKLYNTAKAYKDGLKTPLYKELKAFLEREIEITAKSAIYPGYGEEEHDRLLEARAYKKILNYIETKAAQEERLKKSLEDQGVKV